MFLAGGHQYLSWIVAELQHPKYERLVRRVQEVRDRGKSTMSVGRCYCGKNKAKYFSIYRSGYDLGISPSRVYCDSCKEEIFEEVELLQLSFKNALLFKDSCNQKAYVRVLKYAYFGKSDEVVTKKRAFELFYPEHAKK